MTHEAYQIDVLVCDRTADVMGGAGKNLGHCGDCYTGIWINTEDADLAPTLSPICLPCARERLQAEDVIGVAPSVARDRKYLADLFAQGQP